VVTGVDAEVLTHDVENQSGRGGGDVWVIDKTPETVQSRALHRDVVTARVGILAMRQPHPRMPTQKFVFGLSGGNSRLRRTLRKPDELSETTNTSIAPTLTQ
jgi:hypothetical protein